MQIKTATRMLMGLFYTAAGVNHFVNPAFYISIMPPYLPAHRELVFLSGVAEVLLGLLLLPGRTAPAAAWGVIALLIAVFPANIHMAMRPDLFPDISPALLYLRVPLQFALMAWAYAYTHSASTAMPSDQNSA